MRQVIGLDVSHEQLPGLDLSGFQLIPVMIGMFAVSEVIRYAVSADQPVDVSIT